MARKKKRTKTEIQRDKIVEAYWDAVLIEGNEPRSVYALSKEVEIKESDFYEHFASIEAIEGSFWKTTIEETVSVLVADEDFADYDCHQKLLAFYYTYIAHIQGERSKFVSKFPSVGSCRLKGGASLREAQTVFEAFVGEVLTQGIEEGSVVDRKQLNGFYPRGLFEQYKLIVQYHCKDQSEKFQDTDAFIEKTVKLSSDIMSSGVLDSAFDVVRFLMRNAPFAKGSS